MHECSSSEAVAFIRTRMTAHLSLLIIATRVKASLKQERPQQLLAIIIDLLYIDPYGKTLFLSKPLERKICQRPRFPAVLPSRLRGYGNCQ
jgi:hypothetical protein